MRAVHFGCAGDDRLQARVVAGLRFGRQLDLLGFGLGRELDLLASSMQPLGDVRGAGTASAPTGRGGSMFASPMIFAARWRAQRAWSQPESELDADASLNTTQ